MFEAIVESEVLWEFLALIWTHHSQSLHLVIIANAYSFAHIHLWEWKLGKIDDWDWHRLLYPSDSRSFVYQF